MKKLVISFLAMFLAMAADAASPYFQRIDSETDGLSHNGVRCLLQDSRGYVWIGTQMGLDRYDGTRIKIFSGDDLPSTYIFTLCEDKRGNIWIGTGNGISVYDYEHDRIFEPKMADGTRLNLAIYSITCNSSGEIWFDARKDVLFSFDYNDGFVKTRNVNFKRETIKRIAFNANDCLVICSHMDNVYLCPQGGNAEPLELRSGAELIKDDEIYGPVFTRKSKSVFYVATKRSGVVEINMKERSARLLFRWNALQKPNGIALQDDRYIIAATTSGLVRYDMLTDKREEYYNVRDDVHSLSENFVLSTMVDRNGGVWAGTAQYGVCYTDPALDCFRRYAATSDGKSLQGCNTRGICEDRNGDVWITTERVGLLKYSPSKEKILRVRSAAIPDFLTDIIADGENLWIGTQYGILRYNPVTGEVREYNEFDQGPFSQDSRVICLAKSSGGQIYVGASASTMAYDRESDLYYTTYPINGQGRMAQEEFVRKKAENGDEGKFKWDYDLKPVIVVAILNFKFEHQRDWPADRYHSSYRIREDFSQEVMTDALRFVFLELGRFNKRIWELETVFDKWMYLLKHMHEMVEIPDKFSDPLFKRLFLLAKIGKFTAEEYEQYQKSLTNMGDYDNIINTAVEEAEKRGREVGRAEGEAKGRAEGRNEAIAETVKKFLLLGVDIETISKATGLDIGAIESLK